ncbi:MAG: PfaD family polyunsaturated fatty acid/polyketide biosynthesis protein [Verrucomicrobiia bacterium]|jgi:PfaD family protein
MMSCEQQTTTPLGWWSPSGVPPKSDPARLREAIWNIRQAVTLVTEGGALAVGADGRSILGETKGPAGSFPMAGYAAPVRIENLGDPRFCEDHGVRFPYVTGAMANGIASEEIVIAMAEAGMLGFFGAAGLHPDRVTQAIDRIQQALGDKPYGFNLIHSPNEPALEAAVVDLYLQRGVHLVEASAYLALTLPVVRYRVTGIYRDEEGNVVTPNRIVAKVSRVEVATHFLSPPPEKFLSQLVAAGEITAEQAEMAREIPMAQDLTAEADSGGHTDNRPAIALFPALLSLRDRLQSQYKYLTPLRVGAAGGISTPASAAAAFAMGAAYIVTGSVNQACVESGSSDVVRKLLAQAEQADVAMAPAADMFEMGVKVQVLKRGTMFAMRAGKLYDLYRRHGSLAELSAPERDMLEKQYFRASLEATWESTKAFFREADPSQIDRAEKDPKHQMALVFRSYLGQSSRWANSGEPTRTVDYQVWCGPAMGAFNEWVKGSFLEQPESRQVVVVGMNILYGAAVTLRVNVLRSQGVRLSAELSRPVPFELAELNQLFCQ